ncbi:hypothetical protein BDW62DRAFT_13553 [Aspergillus aurantiobrunneus]
MSILDALSFDLDFPPKLAPYKGGEDMLIRIMEYDTYRNGPQSEQIFELSDHLPLGIYEDAFRSYISAIIQKEDSFRFTYQWCSIYVPPSPRIQRVAYDAALLQRYEYVPQVRTRRKCRGMGEDDTICCAETTLQGK